MHMSALLKLTLMSVFISSPLFALPTLSEAEAEAIATDAYIYGYPLVTMDMTRRVLTNTVTPSANKAPMGQFANVREYPNASFKDVTAPNADTLYSFAWVDLAKEPYVLSVPDEDGRYYLMPMLDGWTDVFAVPGKRTTGTKAGVFAITGPNWKGKLPGGMKEFKSPTNLVWILGRTYSTGTPADYKAVHEIQNRYMLIPLSSWGKAYTPPMGKVDPKLDMKTPVREQVNALDAKTYFSTLAELMKDNPPALKDASIVAEMAKIGLVPGQPFDLAKLDPAISQGVQNAPKKALAKIQAHEDKAGKLENGWMVTAQTGNYGTDYLQRALVAAIGLGANLPQDAIYPVGKVDSQGNALDGTHKYKLHFNKGQMPPVDGFWSLTMYNDSYFFVNNPLNRYTLSPRNDLKYNADGSLDLYIQNESPGKDKESNWLPAPKDQFILMFRFYWPKEELINGTWQPPAIEKVQ
ncbi:MAG: hypothetical protein CK425_10215 [Parachlamydia sp.]|nr:MAG: hypothetical protein CK425_10215 [Parachlamydia sp.]